MDNFRSLLCLRIPTHAHTCHSDIMDDLSKHIKECGLSSRWIEIFQELGIDTLEDLRKSLHTSSIKEELRRQAKQDEEEALRILFECCVLYDDTPCDVRQDQSCLEVSQCGDGAERESGAVDLQQQNPNEVELLEKLGLTSFFPDKITLDVVNKKSSQKLEYVKDIPWYVLSKLLMLDYRARDAIITPNIKRELATACKQPGMPARDDIEDFLTELTGEHSGDVAFAPHPTDVIMAIIMCSSYFVKQIICEKLFLCKLAIPLVLPFPKQPSMLLLWPLRTIHIENYSDRRSCPSVSALKQPIPVISCLRLGEISQSKSKILNEVLNDQSHPTFFHKDCENGMNKRSFSEGSVEVAWQLHVPRSDRSEKVNKTTKVILNLRGNGEAYEATTHFLFKVSNVAIVMIDIQHCKSDYISEFLERVSQYDSSCILVVTKQPNALLGTKEKVEIRMFLETLQKMEFPRERIIFDFEGAKAKNVRVFKEEIERKLDQCLEGVNPRYFEHVFEEAAEAFGITVDEKAVKCRKVKGRAHCLQKCIEEQNNVCLKTHHLRMQCKPWIKWAKLNKEEHRQEHKGNSTIDAYVDKIYREKLKERVEQLRFLQSQTKVFGMFMKDLVSFSKIQRVYYLKWLKIYLDDLSRQILPEQQMKFNQLWNEISLMDDKALGEGPQPKDMKQKRDDLQKRLKSLEQELSDSSFGLEHFMREAAQAYEAFSATRTKNHKIAHIKDLPKIMAELMMQGFPLELMNEMQLTYHLVWVEAVLQQLKQIIGDKKIFVLSILGIQSSGKSTLLNAMFGLQFAVAAGRCTRGVYAQLLPLPEEFSCNKYEYLLVVDTEGLRASELGHEKVQHDNEIATFVIGIGDMTLVNIKGENVTEIEDVLQIVIHALLKMKLVNKRLALQPSCFFIHQNVPAPDAAEKLKLGQLKFMETLNQVTAAAGKQEDAPEITRFRQLIEFDYNTNILYFPDLWKGNPPVAAVNPGYSESISKVKEVLLKDVMRRRTFQVGIQEFLMKLKDLWNGILDQNFVFNFRNSLEIEAYSMLENVQSELQWSLKNAAMKWLNAKRNVIENSDSIADSMEASLTGELRSHLGKELAEVKKKLEKHFESRFAAVLEQWKAKSFIRLQESYNDIERRTIKSLKDELRRKVVQVDSLKDVKKYKSLIMNEAKNWANEIKQDKLDEILNDQDMKVHFRYKWDEWMKKVDCGNDDNEENIESKITKILHETFPEDHVLVRESLSSAQSMSVNLLQQKLYDFVDQYVANNWIHSGWMSKLVTGMLPKAVVGDSPKNKAKMIINKKVSDMHSLVRNASRPIERDDIKVILEGTKAIVNEILKSGIGIELVDQFTVCMAFCFYKYVCEECNQSYKVSIINGNVVDEHNYPNEMFKEVLSRYFPECSPLIEAVLQQVSVKPSVLAVTEQDIKVHRRGVCIVHALVEAVRTLQRLNQKLETYVNKTENLSFKEEYVEEIVKMVKEHAYIHDDVRFTKLFIVKLAVQACYYALPVFCEKHKKYKDSLNPAMYLEREYYDTFYEIFRSSVRKISDEKALAQIVTERLCKAVQSAVDRDIQRELADDVRINVSQVKLKSTLLRAVLHKLLDEDNFEEFMLYLENLDACLRKWIAHFLDEYLFMEGENRCRYVQIVMKEAKILLSKISENALQTSVEVPDEQVTQGDINQWVWEFHKKVSDKVPIPLDDILSLVDGYEVLSIESFKKALSEYLKNSDKKFQRVYVNHSRDHLKNVDPPTIYDIIFEECVGCTERCPFCHAPCTLNNADHIQQEIKHNAKEHYSQACGKYRWVSNNKLVTENCTATVAGNAQFQCNETNYRWHPYKSYHEIFPDWKIHGDISVEATPYWKWFLVKYERQLAERYRAERPDIPESWKQITKDMARESLRN
ncbi:interferon-induced very large GTPase 1-like isoform X1 [Macrobrachium nipponense]|uniref:interferon-induced very large GTPase 1-like isoform X1 n=2 Tax=Macrobrachium nipponense TaxID=159736 RepID=UPI0030C7E349